MKTAARWQPEQAWAHWGTWPGKGDGLGDLAIKSRHETTSIPLPGLAA